VAGSRVRQWRLYSWRSSSGLAQGVVDIDLGAVLLELVDDVDHSSVADVGAVLLKGNAENEHFCPFDFVRKSVDST